MDTLDKPQTTAPALSLGEELRIEIRRGERLLEHYRLSGQRVLEPMMRRELDRARAAEATGNYLWMQRATEALRGYEE